MYKIHAIILYIFSVLQLSAQTIIPAGNVNGIWSQSGSPYRIEGDITIDLEDSLIIEPGVVVDFEGHYKFLIRGELTALGKTGDSIRFTRVSNDAFMDPDTVGLADTSNHEGAWNGIQWSISFGNVSNLSHCIFEYINTVDNSITVWNDHRAPVYFKNSGDGIYMNNSVIRNNHGGRGGGIFATDLVFLDSCLITNNRAHNISRFEHRPAGGIHIYYSDFGEVTNCIITNNRSDGYYAAGGMRIEAGSPLIMNNMISNNSTFIGTESVGGISCTVTKARIIQNLIVNNEGKFTGGIFFDGGGGKLYNNTICNNKGHHNVAGGITFKGASGTTAMNNIIYGNENFDALSQIVLESLSSQPLVKYNLIGDSFTEIGGVENGAISESDNYFGDPTFMNPTGFTGIGDASQAGDWQLTSGTSLVNLGNNEPVDQYSVLKDMAGNRRINYGYVDPGCFELRIESYTPDALVTSPEVWIADTVHITRLTDLQAKVTIFPGVVILSEGHYEIFARDTLYAIGTPNAPILWTVNDTSGFSDPDTENGGWGPIYAGDIYPRIFRHCVFEYGKVNQFISNRIGLIWGYDNANLEVDNCVFRDCHMIHASIIRSSRGVNCTVSSSKFYNNVVTSADAVIYLRDGANFIVRDNLIYNNVCTQRIVSLSGANIDFINNSIYHNEGHVELPQCFNLEFINNTIVKNSRYGTPLGLGDNARIINSIVPDLSIPQEDDYQIISSYVPESLCEGSNCTDLLSDPPIFNNPLPYSGVGPLEEILQADYSLSNISPGVDFGTPDTAGLTLSKTDISGNLRINGARIDLGAYENQGSLPVITSQPAGGSFCVGENHTLGLEYAGSDTVQLNWYKDGVYVAGQDESLSLELNAIQISDEGNYYCEISNSYGKVLSTAVFIKVNAPPEILVQPEDTWHEEGEPLSLLVLYTGSQPFSFQWEKDGEVITDENLPEYRFTPVDSSKEGNYVCKVSNICGTATTDPAAIYLAPQICMVTISESTGNNLVVWEKKSRAAIFTYNIYRESLAAGIYDRLATIPYDELSLFVDTVADPTVQAYLYRITAVDTAGNETDIDLCKVHKTVHLVVSTNPELNTTQLQWDRYFGFDYQTYTIYKSSTGLDFTEAGSLSASLNSWTDPNPTIGDQFYRIGVVKPDPCFPEGGSKKAGTGPYNHSLSNMDDNKLKLGENPPDSILLNNHSVDENQLPGSLVGRLSSRDLDSMDYHTYHLVSGAGDDDNPSFSLIGDLLITANTFDYETKNTYSIRIRSTDNSAIFTENTFTITINDTGESPGGTGISLPDSLMLSNQISNENNLIGDLIGRFTTRDPDTFDIHTYQLVQGNGDDDNSRFLILGDLLMAAHRFDYEEKLQYSIRVRSTDLGINHIENVFIINIIDIDETTGLRVLNAGGLNIFPNPFSHSTTIRFPNPSGESFRMVLMDLSGKTYMNDDEITTSEYLLRKGNLKKGLYFIELRGAKIYRGKIVIN